MLFSYECYFWNWPATGREGSETQTVSLCYNFCSCFDTKQDESGGGGGSSTASLLRGSAAAQRALLTAVLEEGDHTAAAVTPVEQHGLSPRKRAATFIAAGKGAAAAAVAGVAYPPEKMEDAEGEHGQIPL